MITTQAQIKINLPLPLKEYLESKASKFGMPVAGYLKHLILKDVEDMEYPTFQASDSTIEAFKKAIKEKDKAVSFKNVAELDKYLKNL